MIKNIFSFLSIFSFLLLVGCGGGGSKSSPTTQPATSNPTVTFTSYGSDSVSQQEKISINLGESMTSDIDDPKITQVSFQVEVTGGYEGFSYDLADITINGNSATTITENKLVFEGNFQSFSNNKWALNVDLPGTNFKGFGGEVKFTEIKTTVNNSYTNSTNPNFTLSIEKNVDFSSIEFIQHNPVVTGRKLIAGLKALPFRELYNGSVDIRFGLFDEELAGKMYDVTKPNNTLPQIIPIDLSLVESIIIVDNNTQQEHVFYGITDMISLPISFVSDENQLDLSIYATKTQGANLENVGMIINLKGFTDSLHENRWKYLNSPISFYDSNVILERITEDQSSIVKDGEETHLETFRLWEELCESCPEGSTLSYITFNYQVEHVDINNSTLKFSIDGQTQYDGMIILNDNNNIVFTPNNNVVINTDISRLDVYTTASVNGNPSEPKLGIYPETITYLTASGIMITKKYQVD